MVPNHPLSGHSQFTVPLHHFEGSVKKVFDFEASKRLVLNFMPPSLLWEFKRQRKGLFGLSNRNEKGF